MENSGPKPADVPPAGGRAGQRPRSRPGGGQNTLAPAPAADAEREELFASFQPLIQRLTSRVGDDPDLRQELPGEIYCRFCALVEAYDPARGVPRRAYLVRTLTAAVHSYTRSRRRCRSREVNLDAGIEERIPAGVTDPADEWNDRLLRQQVLAQLPAALGGLPPRQRRVVLWRFFEGRSHDEIARLLCVQPSTARSLLRHALANLRRRVLPDE